jgi:hypothetical protein
MLEELRTLNLVIRLAYSDYKPKMVDKRGKSSNISETKDSDSSLYYLLNWSNPESKMMLADYQNKIARKEILNTTKKASEYSTKEISVYNTLEAKELSSDIK